MFFKDYNFAAKFLKSSFSTGAGLHQDYNFAAKFLKSSFSTGAGLHQEKFRLSVLWHSGGDLNQARNSSYIFRAVIQRNW
jgi:hypothetical protein